MNATQRDALNRRLENWWLNMTPAQEERLLNWVFDFGEFHQRSVRSWGNQALAWITGRL